MNVVSEYLELFLAFSGVVAALAAFVRWGQKGLEKKISAQIKEATRQIQPLANGGLSLSDVARGVRELRENQINIGDRLEALDEKFSERMDKSEAARDRVLAQFEQDRQAWVDLLTSQGIEVPNTNPVKYRRGKQ
jgi:hypothetical protein